MRTPRYLIGQKILSGSKVQRGPLKTSNKVPVMPSLEGRSHSQALFIIFFFFLIAVISSYFRSAHFKSLRHVLRSFYAVSYAIFCVTESQPRGAHLKKFLPVMKSGFFCLHRNPYYKLHTDKTVEISAYLRCRMIPGVCIINFFRSKSANKITLDMLSGTEFLPLNH